METFEHSKCKPLAIAVAVEETSRRVVAIEVARMPSKGNLAAISRKKYGPRKDQRPAALRGILSEVKRLYPHLGTVKSDECPRYPPYVTAPMVVVVALPETASEPPATVALVPSPMPSSMVAPVVQLAARELLELAALAVALGANGVITGPLAQVAAIRVVLAPTVDLALVVGLSSPVHHKHSQVESAPETVR